MAKPSGLDKFPDSRGQQGEDDGQRQENAWHADHDGPEPGRPLVSSISTFYELTQRKPKGTNLRSGRGFRI